MNQSCFTPGHSTGSAATVILGDVLNSLDHKQNQSAALFIDLSKGFDTVDRHILIQRLTEIGLGQAFCKWFENDLSDRTQCMISDGVQSSFLDITKGVPQGSVLGPVLFTIYVNNTGLSVNL